MAGTPGEYAAMASALAVALGLVRVVESLIVKRWSGNNSGSGANGARRVLEVQEAKQQQQIVTTLESIDDKLDDIKVNTSKYMRCPMVDKGGLYRG